MGLNCTVTFQNESKAGFSQYTAIEQSKNKIIMHFENEVESEVLWSSNQQTYNLQHLAQHGRNRHMISCMWFCAFGILAALVFVER